MSSLTMSSLTMSSLTMNSLTMSGLTMSSLTMSSRTNAVIVCIYEIYFEHRFISTVEHRQQSLSLYHITHRGDRGRSRHGAGRDSLVFDVKTYYLSVFESCTAFTLTWTTSDAILCYSAMRAYTGSRIQPQKSPKSKISTVQNFCYNCLKCWYLKLRVNYFKRVMS
jgi:hypothetical protein